MVLKMFNTSAPKKKSVIGCQTNGIENKKLNGRYDIFLFRVVDYLMKMGGIWGKWKKWNYKCPGFSSNVHYIVVNYLMKVGSGEMGEVEL